MFEVHGWATIRFTPENRDRDDEEEMQQRAVAQVEDYVRTLGWGNPLMELRWMNGQAHVWIEGFRNHAAGVTDGVQALFQCIAQVAPGSYGLLYTLDDEDAAHADAFRVYVLARGILAERSDPFLSPFVPVVEDPYRDD
jgi:Immunity protein 7